MTPSPQPPRRERHAGWLIAGLLLLIGLGAILIVYALREPDRLNAAQRAINADRIARGAQLFAAHCATCHGASGEGGVGTALNSRPFLKSKSDALLFSVIRSGVPNSPMPAWSTSLGGQLTDENIRDVVAFVRSWEATAPHPALKNTADADRGAQIYRNICAECHGLEGEGGAGIKLNDAPYLAKTPDEVLFSIVRAGKPGTQMAAHSVDYGGTLTDAAIKDVIAFLRGWENPASVVIVDRPADAVRGALIFMSNCVDCHGVHGEGGIGAILNNRSLLDTTSNDDLFSSIYAGVPMTQMQPWGKNFGGPFEHQDVRDLVAFIRQWEPTAPQVTAPAPDAFRGAELYATACSMCHGPDGKGGSATALNRLSRLQQFDDEWYRDAIAYGRPGRGMPTWGTVLSPDQIADLVALIAAWRQELDIVVPYDVPQSIDRAVFALVHGDTRSALLHIDHALHYSLEREAEVLRQARAQVLCGQREAAIGTLEDLWAAYPFGDAIAGQDMYVQYCRRCHGDPASGNLGTDLNANRFIQATINSDLVKLVLDGRPGTEMFGLRDKITEQQAADVVAYLRLWQPYVPGLSPIEPLVIPPQSDMPGNCATCHDKSQQSGDN
jgi:mono/diheme cytochrome c family protein